MAESQAETLEALLRCELNDKSFENVNRFELRLIESAEGERVGILTHPFYNWGSMLPATGYELRPGLSWAAVTPSVVPTAAPTPFSTAQSASVPVYSHPVSSGG